MRGSNVQACLVFDLTHWPLDHWNALDALLLMRPVVPRAEGYWVPKLQCLVACLLVTAICTLTLCVAYGASLIPE